MMELQQLIFRSKLSSNLDFDYLKQRLEGRVGKRIHKGHIGKNYISLFYFADTINEQMGLNLISLPTFQIIIDQSLVEEDKQLIRFQFATFALIIFICVIVGINAWFILYRESRPLIGLLVSAFLYTLVQIIFQWQRGCFIEDLMDIEQQSL